MIGRVAGRPARRAKTAIGCNLCVGGAAPLCRCVMMISVEYCARLCLAENNFNGLFAMQTDTQMATHRGE